MKGILKFILIFTSILLLSALLAPFLFKFLPQVSEWLSGFTPLAPDAFKWKFERIFNRLVMIFSLTAIVIAVRRNMVQFPLETIRWEKGRSLKLYQAGFAAGFAVLVCVLAFKTVMGLVSWHVKDLGFWGWVERFAMSFLAAALIGLIEECFFRGFIFHTLFKRFRFPLTASLLVTNLFYSLIHFVSEKKPFIGPDPGFFDSLKLIQAPFMALLHFDRILPGATGLFIFGIILSLIYLETRSLYACMGLHAGCVFFLKLDGGFTYHEQYLPLVFGTSQCYDGLVGWIFLILMGVFVIYLLRKLKLSVVWAVMLLCLLPFSAPSVMAQNETAAVDAESGSEKLSALEMWRRKKEQLLASEQPAPSTSVSVPAQAEAEPATVSIDDFFKQNRQPEPVIEKSPEAPVLKLPPAEAVEPETAAVAAIREIPQAVQAEAPQAPVMTESKPAEPQLKSFDDFQSGLSSSPVSQPLKTSPPAAEQVVRKTGEKVQKRSDGYHLADFLNQADAFNFKDRTELSSGRYDNGTIIFDGMDETAAIRVVEQSYEGVLEKGIYVHPFQNTIRRIQFNGLPTGGRLQINYGIADESVDDKLKSVVYMKIWVGGKQFKRISVFNERGWKKTEIDLGALAFLKSPVTITFDISADDATKRDFCFYAKIA